MKKNISFLLLIALISTLVVAAGQKKTGTDDELFSIESLKKDFRLNLSADPGVSLVLFDEPGLAGIIDIIDAEDYCDPSLFDEKRENQTAEIQPKKLKQKKLGRAVLVNLAVWLTDSIRYWSSYEGWVEDWQFELNWKDQKRRFFSLEANKFDSNPFVTNWAHGMSGGIFYTMARYHRLNALESMLFGMSSSFFWEYVTEWREVVSVNDNFFSGIGGMPIGESLHRLSNYYINRPGAGNKVLAYLLNPVMGLNDLLGGKKWRESFPPIQVSEKDLNLFFGHKQVFKEDESGFSRLFYLGFDIGLETIPGCGDPDKGDIDRFIKKPLFNRFRLDGAIGKIGIEEYNLFHEVVLFARFRQKLRQDGAKNLKGYSFYFGAGTAFDLYRKRSTAYYDKGEFHYDFAAGETATQPTEFSDKLAVVNLIGPALDLSLYSGPLRLRLSFNAYFDFGLINSMAINEYSKFHNLYNPRMKTTLTFYGYHYAFGFTLAPRFRLTYKNLDFRGKCKYQYYDSIEGLDRFYNDIEDDSNVTDSRFWYKLSAGFAIPNSPFEIVFTYEGLDREGSFKEITHREKENRFFTQFKISF